MKAMKENIYWSMTKEAWKRDRFSTISFTAFVAISVAMISLTTMLFTNLTGAIEHLMDVAKTPDFLQMHTGDIDTDEVVSESGIRYYHKDINGDNIQTEN